MEPKVQLIEKISQKIIKIQKRSAGDSSTIEDNMISLLPINSPLTEKSSKAAFSVSQNVQKRTNYPVYSHFNNFSFP